VSGKMTVRGRELVFYFVAQFPPMQNPLAIQGVLSLIPLYKLYLLKKVTFPMIAWGDCISSLFRENRRFTRTVAKLSFYWWMRGLTGRGMSSAAGDSAHSSRSPGVSILPSPSNFFQ
jgi:hypothetical protein